MANFVSSITLQFKDLFSPGMARASSSVSSLQSSLNSITPAGLADISSTTINIPAPEIGTPEIPVPDNPAIDIPTPEIGEPVIPTPDNPPIDIPTPEIPQPTIPAPDISGFQQGLNEIQAGLDKITENNALNTLAAQLSVMSMAVAPIQQSLNSAMEQPSQLAATFESSMKNIQAITGNSAEEMAVLNRQLLDIGKNAEAGPQGAIDAMNDIAGGVDNAASHLGILQGAVLLAEAGQADLGVAANGLVSIMNAYGLASGDAASAMTNAVNVSDVLTQTVGQGVGSMEQFIAAFSQVSGVSASVGVGFDEVGAALAFITTQGPSASEAATQLKAAETALLNPNETLSKALRSVGIESGSAMLAEYGLVESLNIVKQSVGGSQDAMAKALGSTMALQGATALLGDGYTDFSAKFGAAIQNSVTAEAAAVQNQSYEMKMAKMTAATQALQLQVGDNINNIKGFFIDIGAGFLTNVVSPIMGSPIGGVFQQIAAVAGVGGQQLLSFGSSALQTAVQFTTLAANIKNAGGYAEIFHGVMTIMQAPFKTVGGLIKGFITNLFGIGAAGITGAGGTTAMGVASGASTAPIGAAAVATGGLGVAMNSVLLPILAVVAAVALVVGGAYLLIKNWDAVAAFFVNLWNKITGAFSAAWNWIKNTLAGVSDWVLVAVAVFLPFIGIPALIIKHWDAIKVFFSNLGTWLGAFFKSLWTSITGAFSNAWNWIKNTLAGTSDWVLAAVAVFLPFIGIPALIKRHWEGIKTFFINLWNNITGIVANAANWFAGAWNNVVSGFVNLWNNVTVFFSNLWNGITQIVANVANWFAGIWGTVTAPFAAAFTWIGNFFISIWDKIKGVIQGFIDWMSPVIDAILAPFRMLGNVIGGIINTVGGWFNKGVDAGNEAVANKKTKLQNDIVPESISASSAADISAAPVTNAAVISTPDLATTTSTISTPEAITAPSSPAITAGNPNIATAAIPEIQSGTQSVGNTFAGTALAAEHIEAAQRKGIASSDISYAASSAFDNAGNFVVPALPLSDIEEEAKVTFAAAMPRRETPEAKQEKTETRNEGPRQNIFHIANMNFNADELRSVFDFVRRLELLTAEAAL